MHHPIQVFAWENPWCAVDILSMPVHRKSFVSVKPSPVGSNRDQIGERSFVVIPIVCRHIAHPPYRSGFRLRVHSIPSFCSSAAGSSKEQEPNEWIPFFRRFSSSRIFRE